MNALQGPAKEHTHALLFSLTFLYTHVQRGCVCVHRTEEDELGELSFKWTAVIKVQRN